MIGVQRNRSVGVCFVGTHTHTHRRSVVRALDRTANAELTAGPVRSACESFSVCVVTISVDGVRPKIG